MILQALVELYDSLVKKGKLDQPGWQEIKVTHALMLDQDGALARVVPLMSPDPVGKKGKMIPRVMKLPVQAKRTVGIAANFLCDNSSYILGVDAKGKPQRSKDCFAACGERHSALLAEVDHPAARAVVRFFENWQPEHAHEHPGLLPVWDEIISGGNIVFMVGDEFVHEIQQVRAAWNTAYSDSGDGESMRCLVTGEMSAIARLHPSIKGVRNAQSSGASLVSFNAPAYDSFGRDGGQGANAPVSQRAAFAYGSALNYLVSKQEHRVFLGDMTVVFWAEDAEEEPVDCFAALLGGEETIAEDDFKNLMRALASGKAVQWRDVPIYPSNRFYVLGLAPNAARLSVRFFIQENFGTLAARMERHYERLEIIRPKFDTRAQLSVWSLLNETVNAKSRDKSASPQMSGDMLRAILTGGLYPATLLNLTELRIRAEHVITRGRAAIIKAYLLRNVCETGSNDEYREALQVELNENSNNRAYVLGRLFSVLEALQKAANPGINTTIVDRYFNSACATPAVVFPQLIRLAQAHLKKLSEGNRIYFNRQITELVGKFDSEYPVRLGLYEQGIFQIGYYHQTQKRYEKKEDK